MALLNADDAITYSTMQTSEPSTPPAQERASKKSDDEKDLDGQVTKETTRQSPHAKRELCLANEDVNTEWWGGPENGLAKKLVEYSG